MAGILITLVLGVAGAGVGLGFWFHKLGTMEQKLEEKNNEVVHLNEELHKLKLTTSANESSEISLVYSVTDSFVDFYTN